MPSSKISEVAESLYAIAHSGITDTINFIEKICEEIFEKHQPFDKEIRNKIGLEFMALFFHVTSRAAITILGEDKAWELTKAQELIFKDYMMDSVKNGLENNRKDLELSLQLMLNERHLEYAKHKAFAEKDEGLKNTLFFEFGKYICEAAGYPPDIRLVIAACSQAFAFVEGVDWKKILGQTR